jgi:hypothetical protein
MLITPNKWGSRLPIEQLTSGAVSCFTNVTRQNSWGGVWADKPATRNRRRRLIYRDVNFVIRRFREVGLRNRGDQRHAGEQEQNEGPDCTHRCVASTDAMIAT